MSKKFENILVISDLDGTFLDKELDIPKNNIDAVEYFIENGGYFTVATGRPPQSVEVLLKSFKVNAPGIVFNGGGIYDFAKKEYLYTLCLDNSAKEIVKLIISRFKNVGIVIYSGKIMYSPVDNDMYHRMMNVEKSASKFCDIDEIPFPWFKIVFVGEMSDLEKVNDYLKFVDTEKFDLIFSNYFLFEILPKGSSKGSALNLYNEVTNLNINKKVAIGDYYNDVEMLQNADFPVAVENAPDDVKALSKYITTCNNNGAIADLIRYLEEIIV